MWTDDDDDLKHAMTGEREPNEPPPWLGLTLLVMLGLLLGYVMARMIG